MEVDLSSQVPMAGLRVEGEAEAVAEVPSAADAFTPFAKFSASAVLDTKKKCQSVGFPHGVLLSPFVPTPEPLPLVRRAPLRCSKCKAYMNSHCRSEPAEAGGMHWWCVFCGKDTFMRALGPVTSREDYPDLTHTAVDYVDPSNQPPLYKSTLMSRNPTYAFLVDANGSREDMQCLHTAIVSTLELLPPNAQLVFIAFANIVSVYELGVSGVSSAEVYPGVRAPTADERERLRVKAARFCVPLRQCKESVNEILLHLVESALGDNEGPRGRQTSERCFGTALSIAMEVVRDEDGDVPEARLENYVGGRVCAFLSGCPNFGPGGISETDQSEQDIEFQVKAATTFYRRLARLAFLHNFSIDVYCVGLRNFRVQMLQNLVLSNGGVVLLVKTYEDTVLIENLHASVGKTVGRNASFTVRTSDAIAITHIVGPAVASESSIETPTLSSCVVASVEAQHGFSIFYRVTEDIVYDYVHFQFAVSYTNARGEAVKRISTHKLVATGKEHAFYQAVQPAVLAALMGKRFVLEARKRPTMELDEVTESLDKAASKILVRAQKLCSGVPACVYDVVLRLFLLRRGPMLGPILQHPDDMDGIRCLYLQAAFETCDRIVQPFFGFVADDGSLVQDMALRDDKVLLLDHYTDIFIWSGRKVTGSEFDGLRQTAADAAARASTGRYPRPYMMQFTEGSSMARWLLCRLIPSHKDPKEMHCRSFPDLMHVPEADYVALVGKFHDTDDESLAQYMARLQQA